MPARVCSREDEGDGLARVDQSGGSSLRPAATRGDSRWLADGRMGPMGPMGLMGLMRAQVGCEATHGIACIGTG